MPTTIAVIGIVYALPPGASGSNPEINWVNNSRILDPGITLGQDQPDAARADGDHASRIAPASCRWPPGRCAPFQFGRLASEEQRETTRYLVGLLVFLGLLGTFWGLLQTVSTVGATIGALDTNAGDNVMLFDQLKEGLAGPLKGMGTASPPRCSDSRAR